MSRQTKSAIWAWVVTFAAGLLTVLTQVMTNGGGIMNIDPLAVLIAALAALVSVDKDRRSQYSYPPDSATLIYERGKPQPFDGGERRRHPRPADEPPRDYSGDH